MIYSKHSTARRFTHTIWCCMVVLLSLFKAVVSTGQSRDQRHGPWQFVCESSRCSGNVSLHSLKLVRFGSRTPGAAVGAPGAPGPGLVLSRRSPRRSPLPLGGDSSPLFLLRPLLESHQVCRNLLLVTLAGSAQVLKPQHGIHPIAGLKLVRVSFLRVSEQEEVGVLWVVRHHHHAPHHGHVLARCGFEMLSLCGLERLGSVVEKLGPTQGCPVFCPRRHFRLFAFL